MSQNPKFVWFFWVPSPINSFLLNNLNRLISILAHPIKVGMVVVVVVSVDIIVAVVVVVSVDIVVFGVGVVTFYTT